MKNRKLKRWIPLILCASMLLTLIAPFVPGVFAKKEGAAPCCGLEEHTHTETCCNHECLWYCYSDENPTPMSAQGETARAIYENLRARMEAAGAAPQDGTVYRYNDETYSFVNFFYLVGNWYLLGQGDNYSGVLHDPADDPEAGNFVAIQAIKIRESVPHTSRCLLCGKTEHTHTDACYKASAEPESAEAESASVELMWDGYAVNNFVIKPSEKATVEAVPHGLTAPSFQWQILMPQTASWINIGDKTAEKCEISYALVKNMLDDADGTYLRCVVTGSDGVQATTDPLGVTVTPEQEYDEAAMAQPSEADEAVALMISKLRSTVNSFIQPKSVGPDTNPVGAAGEGFVTITIKYLDYQKSMIDHALEEESTVYSPYVATIEQGTPFQQAVVKSPLLVGFAPLYDANNDGVVSDSEDASEIRFDTTANVDTDVEIKVYYKAMNVRYAVRYYFQNIIDDLYTEDSAKYHSGTALAGSIIQSSNLELSPEPVGFVSLFHVPLEVAPDGSTVFECYYDRNYYLVQFVLGDGGYGVDPVYARYGAQVNVGTPSRPGYDFAGWELYKIDENDNGEWDDTDLSTNPATEATVIPNVLEHNYCYRALWTPHQVNYTIAYWIDHDPAVNNEKKSLIKTVTASAVPGTEVSAGDDLQGDMIAGPLICEKAEHTHTDACYHCKHTVPCWYCYSQIELLSNAPPCPVDDNFNDNAAGSGWYNPRGLFNDLIKKLKANKEDPKDGYVYKFRSGGIGNYLYISGNWYYLGLDSTYSGIECEGGYPSNPVLMSYSYNSKPAILKYSNHHYTSGDHERECLDCTLYHTHGPECYGPSLLDRDHYEYYSTETKTVAADGSTVVNVYYRPKKYTLKFYYAATKNGDVLIIGGSTFPFGSLGGDISNEIQALDYCFNYDGGSAVGRIEGLPQLKSSISRPYETGTDYSTSSGRTYYYIKFTAEYKQNISKLWPCNVFQPAKNLDKNTTNPKNGFSGEYAYVSAWNGEYRVWYTQHNSNVLNPGLSKNETIKGNNEVLDETLLFEVPKFSDEDTVSYLCFWENGAEGLNWNVPNLFVYNIWVPVLPGEELSGTTITYGSTTYRLKESYETCDDNTDDSGLYTNQTRPTLVGYQFEELQGRPLNENELKAYGVYVGNTYVGGYNAGYDVDFYYSRLSYKFQMMNYGTQLFAETMVPYETNLRNWIGANTTLESDSDYGFKPEYPASLESDAYEFKGWYTTETCHEGTEFDLETAVTAETDTMPAGGLVLYAKWEPKKYTVNFYDSYSAMQNAASGPSPVGVDSPQFVDPQTWPKTVQVSHGSTAEGIVSPYDDPDDDMKFSGWFYEDNGRKIAYTPSEIPVKRNLNVFADWNGKEVARYRLSYVLKGTNTKLAEDTVGYAIVGSTRTFTAKSGDKLGLVDSSDTNHYFPLVGAHSINIHEGSGDSDNPENSYTFEYVSANDVSYKVLYVNKENGAALAEELSDHENAAIVTKRFQPISDYVPDAFYKSLTLEVEWSETQQKYVGKDTNVITFYYSHNEGYAPYAVHFMLEKIDATAAQKEQYNIDGSGGYEELKEMYIEGVGEVNNSLYIPPQPITGFTEITTADTAKYVTTGGTSSANYSASGFELPVTAGGTELYIFYSRNTYPYHVYHYEVNTTTQVPGLSAVSGNAPYGKKISASEFFGEVPDEYTRITAGDANIQIQPTLPDDPDDTITGLNNLIIQYKPKQYRVDYVVVSGEGGWLSQSKDTASGADPLVGTVPTPDPSYGFDGWYLEEECIHSADAYFDYIEATGTYIPKKTMLVDSPDSTVSNVFYAKFVKLVGDFTITRTGTAAEDANQFFVYEIKNKDTPSLVYYVTLRGNGSKTISDLPLGSYTVTQQNDWSWRYADAVQDNVEHNAGGTTVTFNGNVDNEKWINGNSDKTTNKRGS